MFSVVTGRHPLKRLNEDELLNYMFEIAMSACGTIPPTIILILLEHEHPIPGQMQKWRSLSLHSRCLRYARAGKRCWRRSNNGGSNGNPGCGCDKHGAAVQVFRKR